MQKKLKKLVKNAGLQFSPKRTPKGIEGYFRFAQGRMLASRVSLCNHLILTYGLDSYLEIGTRNKSKMNNLILARRVASVDPDPAAEPEYLMTSDEYFAQHDEKFDLIFIDGLHTGDQVKRDIDNALARLSPRGMILLHDLNPPTAFHAREVYEVDGKFPNWNGTSWEGYAWHRKHSPDLEMHVVDTDWGVGFVRPGKQVTWDGPTEGYETLAAHRQELLNLVSVTEFLQRHPSH